MRPGDCNRDPIGNRRGAELVRAEIVGNRLRDYRLSLGDRTREVHGGATVFIPANTWISVTNIGTEAISCFFVFSALGFDDFMRAESVPEGQKITPLTKAEDAQIMKEHADALIYAEP